MSRLLVLFFLLGATSQGQTLVTGPGYDPSPVSIEPVAQTTPRPITSKDLIAMRDLVGLAASPDGKYVAFVLNQAVLETNSYKTGLFVVGTQFPGLLRNLGSVGPARWSDRGQVHISPEWSPDSKDVTYLVNNSGKGQIWRWRINGGSPEQLTSANSDVQEYEWSPDGKKIIFKTIEPPSLEEAKKKAQEGIVWDGSIAASKGRPIMRWVSESLPRKTQLWIYDLEKRTERYATSEEEANYKTSHEALNGVAFGRYKISPNGNAVAYLSVLDDPKRYPYTTLVINVREKSKTNAVQLTEPSLNFIEDIWWSKDGSQIYFINGTLGLYTVPAKGGPSRRITNTSELIHNCSFATVGTFAACSREGPLKPPDLALVDVRDGSIRTLVELNPEFKNIKLSPATRLEWKNKYGDTAFGHLVKPLNYEVGKRYPLIVTTYRSNGFLRGATGDEYPIQLFAANGFAVLSFDAASGRPEGQDFKTSMIRWYSPIAMFELAFKGLDEMGIIDPTRRGISGLSYGADITEFAISHTDLFQAAATSGGSGRDPLFYYLSGNAGAKLFRDYLGGWPAGDAAPKWQELSPALNVEKVNAALLINATDREYISVLQFYTALKEYRKPVELIIYPDELHIKTQPVHRYNIYERNVDWFKFWLQNSEDPDPAKAEQYKRWRELKKLKSPSTVIN